MSQYVPNSSALAQHSGGIGALGDLTFVSEVIIVERAASREFFTLKGESLGVVKKAEWPIGVSLPASTKSEIYFMPSKSHAQHRLVEAAAHNKAFAKKAGIPQKVAKEFVAADKASGKYRKKK